MNSSSSTWNLSVHSLSDGDGKHEVMRIGLLADSHGRADMTARAVATLQRAETQMLLHLGDIETEAVLDELVGHNAHVVFGNCDWNERDLARYAEHMDISVDHPAGRLEIGGKVLVFTHGHLVNFMDKAISSGVDYLVHGHTHTLRDERIGSTRVINPGALFRAARYTVAVLDLAEDTVQFLEVPRRDGERGDQ